MSLGDQWNRLTGKSRFVVTRIFVHLAGSEVAPLLGKLNQIAREAIEAEGDLDVLGQGLSDLCESLLQYRTYWQSASNEGDVFWDEGEAGDRFNDLFTDSAARYLSQPDLDLPSQLDDDLLTLPATSNLLVMLTVGYEGEVPSLETNLADSEALATGLKALANLHYNQKLRAVQVHFAPARLGDELTNDQLLQNFPELIPL
ncbi:MAG: DUF1517 domain-containing protein [Limnothrix sp.]|jgi:hypothetical protein|uniref:DUF1517 domain-containing protein n=1 Tax=Limnothrix redekei LRLZ20PSL1 TaxID=3112953 RepID=A0ABW7CDI8_9CYAN|nr:MULTISPECIES: DUF1517 domain-containing protein [unclassified Limnothrix]MEB3117158.1 DUF1517 domain-containing protein [Limnothrix sp.]OCQ92523.1 hypothetical protein BCR12_17340 [Limnothrix sp. P13C2]MBD2553045.1 DUF1517 domain-containing protein [Limnothrix sp. FACHB-708]MBD2589144.1 DUF1517 domain-containing protein [Limnothrix sp. FACHB-406]MBD2636047.1 DUF1517 domain-containing protein [Limnothrix sp. FACHB-881]